LSKDQNKDLWDFKNMMLSPIIKQRGEGRGLTDRPSIMISFGNTVKYSAYNYVGFFSFRNIETTM
jgi:hypothetical protein